MIEIENENIKKTELATALYAKIAKRRGGLFSVVDNCLAALNSPRIRLPHIDTSPDLDFLTPEYIIDKFKEYQEWARRGGQHS